MSRGLPSFKISSFAGEWDGASSEGQPLQAVEVRNLYLEPGSLKRRKGTAKLGLSDLSPAQDLDGLDWLKIAATEYLLAYHNGRVTDWFAAVPGTEVTNSAGKLTSGADANGAWVDGKFYVGDGVKQNIRFQGSRVDQAMTDTPASAPTFAADTAGGLTGTYRYRITFMNADGVHSEPGPVSADRTVAANTINLTAIPTCPAGQDCSGRGIWRNKNGGTDLFLVGTIANNTATTFSDNVADGSLVTLIVLNNTRFPPTRYLAAHQNRLVGAHCETAEGDLRTVYVSNAHEPYFAPVLPDLENPDQGTRITLQDPNAGEITGLHSHGDRVMVFTATAAYVLITTDQLLDWVLHRFTDHGCVAHRTIASTRDAVLWLGTDGVYMAREGAGVQLVSDDIKRTIQAISPADARKAHAFVYDGRYYLCWPSGCRVYDLDRGAWTRNTAWAWRDGAVGAKTATAEERLYAAQLGVARVWQLETGITDQGAAISTRWESLDLDMGAPYHEKRLHRVKPVWKAVSGTATLSLFTEGGTVAVQTATKMLGLADAVGSTLSSLDQRCVEQLRAERFRYRIDFEDAAVTDYEFYAITTLFTLAT